MSEHENNPLHPLNTASKFDVTNAGNVESLLQWARIDQAAFWGAQTIQDQMDLCFAAELRTPGILATSLKPVMDQLSARYGVNGDAPAWEKPLSKARGFSGVPAPQYDTIQSRYEDVAGGYGQTTEEMDAFFQDFFSNIDPEAMEHDFGRHRNVHYNSDALKKALSGRFPNFSPADISAFAIELMKIDWAKHQMQQLDDLDPKDRKSLFSATRLTRPMHEANVLLLSSFMDKNPSDIVREIETHYAGLAKDRHLLASYAITRVFIEGLAQHPFSNLTHYMFFTEATAQETNRLKAENQRLKDENQKIKAELKEVNAQLRWQETEDGPSALKRILQWGGYFAAGGIMLWQGSKEVPKTSSPSYPDAANTVQYQPNHDRAMNPTGDSSAYKGPPFWQAKIKKLEEDQKRNQKIIPGGK